jgi:hypothetical protein
MPRHPPTPRRWGWPLPNPLACAALARREDGRATHPPGGKAGRCQAPSPPIPLMSMPRWSNMLITVFFMACPGTRVVTSNRINVFGVCVNKLIKFKITFVL